MIIAILVLTVFNTGLILFCLGGIWIFKDEVEKRITAAKKHTDESIEAATTALFNMDSLKQKATMSGRVEL